MATITTEYGKLSSNKTRTVYLKIRSGKTEKRINTHVKVTLFRLFLAKRVSAKVTLMKHSTTLAVLKWQISTSPRTFLSSTTTISSSLNESSKRSLLRCIVFSMGQPNTPESNISGFGRAAKEQARPVFMGVFTRWSDVPFPKSFRQTCLSDFG